MTGPEFKKLCERKGVEPKVVAEDVGVSLSTVLMWFRSAVLDKRTTLALTQLGYISNEGTRGTERTVRA